MGTSEPPDRPVEFFFDPMCPWAYQTSRWMREVRDRLGLEVSWRFFSLEEVNRIDGRKHPWERAWSYGWSQMRVGAYLRRVGMNEVDRWYAAIGSAFHERGVRTHEPAVHAALLDELGHPPGTLDAALADTTTTDEVRADHDHALATLGAFGVPTIVLPSGDTVFGPVVTPAPIGEAALELWDLVTAWRAFPHLYELRRPKTADDIAHIARGFAPYLAARDWQTVENPAP